MGNRTPAIMLTFSAVLSAVCGIVHAAAFRKAQMGIGRSNLPHFYAGSSEALWLSDSATLFILAIVLGVIAIRPSSASRSIVILIALIPLSTAVLLYIFLGNFFAGHLLLAIAVLTVLGAIQLGTAPS